MVQHGQKYNFKFTILLGIQWWYKKEIIKKEANHIWYNNGIPVKEGFYFIKKMK